MTPMKINSIVHRYIFLEMIPPFFISLAFFTFVFLMTKILDITNLIVNYSISMTKIGLLLFYSMPYFLVFVIPMSVLMAVLLTFLRLSNDNEIIALKAGGVSLYRLLPPAMLFCFIGSIATAFMAMYVSPWGRWSARYLVYDVAQSNISIGLKERTFNDSFSGVMLYADKIDIKENSLFNVFIEDSRNDRVVSTIVSPRGALYKNPKDLSYRLRLHNGTINQINIGQKVSNSMKFETYDVILDIRSAIHKAKQDSKKEEKEMYINELNEYLTTAKHKDTRYYKSLIQFHNKFSIPFACIAFGILGVPLGVQSKSDRKSYGLVLGLIFFLLYYLLLLMGWILGKSGTFPPLMGSWVPNIVIMVIGLFLLFRTARENPVGIHSVRDVLKRAGFRFTS